MTERIVADELAAVVVHLAATGLHLAVGEQDGEDDDGEDDGSA